MEGDKVKEGLIIALGVKRICQMFKHNIIQDSKLFYRNTHLSSDEESTEEKDEESETQEDQVPDTE